MEPLIKGSKMEPLIKGNKNGVFNTSQKFNI